MRESTSIDDTYGGLIQSFGYAYQEGTVYRVKGRLTINKADRVAREEGVEMETVYNLEIRANEGWRPKKGMVVGVDDGYRVFVCSIVDIRNEDMKRKRWDLKIVEVE